MTNSILSFAVQGTAMDLAVKMSISEANSQRILGYLTAGTPYGVVTEADGTARAATPEEAAQAFAAGILQGLLDQTARYEREIAARAAADAVQPIAPE